MKHTSPPGMTPHPVPLTPPVLTALALCLAASTSLAAPTFQDRTADLKLTLNGAASAWGDVNGDGWIDLYNGGKVWLNLEGKAFRSLPAKGRGVIADVDNDGLGDLVSYAPIAILRNTGKETFEPLPLPELPETIARGAACGDYNGDGFVDVYLSGYEVWDKQITYPDLLLLNKAGKGFELALTFPPYRARGVTACDYDQDHDLDIYISNYRLLPNVLWQNDGTAKFEDVAAKQNAVATSDDFGGGHSIGAAWGDFDSDGHLDLFAGNFAHVDSRGDQPKSRFLRNLGPKKGFTFEDRGTCGVFYQESYASPAAADFDNDGDLDLYFTTVYGTASFGKKNYPVLFHNDGDFSFSDQTKGSGLEELPPTYQAAWADFDGDGDLDLVTAGKLFVNEGEPGHWIAVRLQGDGEHVDTAAIGTQVRIRLGERVLTRQVEAGTGEGNANSPVLHFGLGGHEGPVTLEIIWLDGTAQTISEAATGRTHAIRYPSIAGEDG
ncbi:MAG: CRTAC1 family protein [Phycisphaerales bacterium JB038]